MPGSSETSSSIQVFWPRLCTVLHTQKAWEYINVTYSYNKTMGRGGGGQTALLGWPSAVHRDQ
jgi:hypothetical protein